MPIEFRRAKVTLTGATEAVLVSHPGGTVQSVVVIGLDLPNPDNAAHTFTVQHKTGGGAYSPVKSARVEKPAPGYPPFSLGDIKLTVLEAGDSLVVAMEGPHSSVAPVAAVDWMEKTP